jgi:hypothetical protein
MLKPMNINVDGYVASSWLVATNMPWISPCGPLDFEIASNWHHLVWPKWSISYNGSYVKVVVPHVHIMQWNTMEAIWIVFDPAHFAFM